MQGGVCYTCFFKGPQNEALTPLHRSLPILQAQWGHSQQQSRFKTPPLLTPPTPLASVSCFVPVSKPVLMVCFSVCKWERGPDLSHQAVGRMQVLRDVNMEGPLRYWLA